MESEHTPIEVRCYDGGWLVCVKCSCDPTILPTTSHDDQGDPEVSTPTKENTMRDITIPGTDQSVASFVEFRDGGLSVILVYRPDDIARHLRTLANEYRKQRPDSHSAHVALNLADVMLGAGPKEVVWYGSADAADWAADGSPQNVAPDVPCEGCAIGDCIRFGCQRKALPCEGCAIGDCIRFGCQRKAMGGPSNVTDDCYARAEDDA